MTDDVTQAGAVTGISLDPLAMQAYYQLGKEADRLDPATRGWLEFVRTQEILLRALPPAPAVVADIGGGPGRYSLWLAGLGYQVVHRDLMPLHVQQLSAAIPPGAVIESGVGDARDLDLDGASVDALLLLGPLYHLEQEADRLLALREAGRVVRPGGPVFAAAISRWAPRLDGVLRGRLYEQYPHMPEMVEVAERTGVLEPLYAGSFCGYTHRPAELAAEVAAAGLEVTDLVSVEGAATLLTDLQDRMADPVAWQIVLSAARELERVPELLGIGPHLVATARRP
ncbi:MAG TPA: methyltransferase domain-containing protein [Streptosporangiaceae bacterium]|nr:methyltransferase domain-containing protein [Streptosporangiaceae bacterium]